MCELLELYGSLQDLLWDVYDEQTLIDADKKMSEIENCFTQLIDQTDSYLVYFPKQCDQIKEVYVLGADAHNIAHAIELHFPYTIVHWVTNLCMFLDDDIKDIDYLVISPKATTILLSDSEYYKSICSKIQINTVGIVSLAYFDEEIGIFYDQSNINGLVVNSIDERGIACVKRCVGQRSCDTKRLKYQTIYVACPAGIKTGGTEVLHQLVYWINHYYGNAVLALYNRDKSTCLSPPELAEYVAGHMCLYEEIEDSCENAIVLPEVCPLKGVEQRKAAQYYWWLSVDNYVKCFEEKEGAHIFIQSIDSNTRFHLTQSEYSKRFLIDNGISNSKILRLEDYINQCYLDDVEEALSAKKEDIILYNPRKGKEIVDELVRKAPALNWVPIQNMTTSEVRTLMRRSKVYIDFGNHPGKDRIPREAAISGCIVITGKRGSALYEEDVSIPENYKFDDECIYEDIITLIKKSLKNYEEDINNFKKYRQRIIEEKDRFVSDILSIFFEPYM